jgi:hypothetical protein
MSAITYSKPATYDKVRTIRAEIPQHDADGSWQPPHTIAVFRYRPEIENGWRVYLPDVLLAGGGSRWGVSLANGMTLPEAKSIADLLVSVQSQVDALALVMSKRERWASIPDHEYHAVLNAIYALPGYAKLRDKVRARKTK